MATPINILPEAVTLENTDKLLIEQAGVAKQLTGERLKQLLASMADGHGGIDRIEKIQTVDLLDIYRITYTDGSHFDFSVRNGTGRVNTVDGLEPDAGGNVALGIVHANLLDNPWFTVNQRGVTTWSSGYGVDRWKLVSGSATVTENGITLNGTLQQILEAAAGAATTASVKMYSGTATAKYNDSTRIFEIVSSGGTIRAAKLEHGSVSTLAGDHAPDYATELLKCQRFQWLFPIGGTTAPIAAGFAWSATNIRMFIPTPTKFRNASPELKFLTGNVGQFSLRGKGTALTPTAVSTSVTSGGIILSFTVSGATGNEVYVLAASSSTVTAIMDNNL